MKKKKGTEAKGDQVIEYRALGPRSEFRADDDDVLRGYAAVFGEEVEIFPGFREKIRRGAFKKTLKESPDIRALWNHDTNFVLARTVNGTLKLKEDAHGLAVEIHPPETQWAKDDIETIRRGDVNQMSFAFRVVKSRWLDEGGDDEDDIVRELLEVRLYEVSPVTFPAYPTTEIALNQARSGVHCGLCKCGKSGQSVDGFTSAIKAYGLDIERGKEEEVMKTIMDARKSGRVLGPVAGEVHSGLAPSESDSPSDHPADLAATAGVTVDEILAAIGVLVGRNVTSVGEPIQLQRGDEQDHSEEEEEETGVANLTTAAMRQKTSELLLRL